MTGIIVYVIGASGAGKDSIMEYARLHFAKITTEQLVDCRPVFVRRHITRPANAGGENHIYVNEKTFMDMVENGDFAMHWQSHGLYYGISKKINHWLQKGKTVIINGSRQYLPTAKKLFTNILPVEIFVPTELLRERLFLRARESTEDIEKRLELAKKITVEADCLFRINNTSTIAAAGEQLVKIIKNTCCKEALEQTCRIPIN